MNMTHVEAAKVVLYGTITDDLRRWAIEVIWQDGVSQGRKAAGGGASPVPHDANIAGDPTGLSKQQIDTILAFKPQGLKINAIKELRQMTGWSLKDSKEKVDDLFRGVDGYLHPAVSQTVCVPIPTGYRRSDARHNGICWRNSISDCGC